MSSSQQCPPGDTLLIGGRWRSASRNMPIQDAWSGQLLAMAACADDADVAAAIQSALHGRAQMAALSTRRRSEILHRAANTVREQSEDFARLIVAEAGKPIVAARREVARCVNTLELAAQEATRLVGETINFDSYSGGDGRSGYFVHEPIGIVVAITPFNDPLNLVAHKLGPALAGGNAVILKPAEQAPLSAIKLVRALFDAGLPEHGINLLTGYGAEFGARLVSDPNVAMVSFTGGETAGARIAESAGIRKLALELGSNSPVIVTENCNLERAVAACVSGAFSAAGQNCIGVQRIYVQRSNYAAFRAAFVAAARQLVVGDPASEQTDVGPMISQQHAARVEQQVTASVALGAQVLLGGFCDGALFAPTILEAVPPHAAVASTEVFGPVVSLFCYELLEDAIAAANRCDSLIHAAIFTNDLQQAMRASRELKAAGVMINDSSDYRLDAMPFGGAGRGGLGREGVKYALREMVQTKVVCFALDESVVNLAPPRCAESPRWRAVHIPGVSLIMTCWLAGKEPHAKFAAEDAARK